MRFSHLLLLCGFITCTTAPVIHAQTTILDSVKERGVVRCGVNINLVGFSTANSLGEYTGFDVDICRGVAAALFNDSEALEMIPLDSVQRFVALEAREIDVLSRNSTWTLTRNALYGDFVGVNYYDGQGFMATKRSGLRSALELDNKLV